ncbi:nucleoside-diphosphate kinase [Vibrio owensii]|uniref:nucleoside-diphosphate kinase n=1 Tax=Vibrio owensii TaxID=696485 RepID=UPI0018F195E3|nr:nucleoside-diphosphate kinase [Vibrio owensii]
MAIEQTFGIIKPDVYRNDDKCIKAIGIVNDIHFSGLCIVEARKCNLTAHQVDEFYKEHSNQPWFHLLREYMTSGPVLLMKIEGEDAVSRYRALCGTTDPKDANIGTLRHKYASSKEENAVHSSDSVESAKRELGFFFPA